ICAESALNPPRPVSTAPCQRLARAKWGRSCRTAPDRQGEVDMQSLSTARTEALCLICGQVDHRRAWTVGRIVKLLVGLLVLGYAAYSTLQQRVITIQEITQGARAGYH